MANCVDLNNVHDAEEDDAEEVGTDCDLDERPGTPDELIEMANSASKELLPFKSKARYEQTLREFKNWQETKKTTSNSERVLLSYFSELKGLKGKLSPATLWSRFSMLKATLKIYEHVDIGSYTSLTAFLKVQLKGHKPKKAKVLTEVELRRFIEEAPDHVWLDVKVACIFAIFGCCRSHEFPSIEMSDITRYPDMYYVDIKETKTSTPNAFAITEPLVSVVKRYENLRPPKATSNRFFLNFQNGKCTVQVIGKNKFYQMPRRIAEFLKLPDVDRYTGHSFRRSSSTLYANTGASIESVKRHTGHKSTKICESYIEDCIENKRKRGNEIMSALNNAWPPTARPSSSSEATTDSGSRRSVTTSSASSTSAPVEDRHSVDFRTIASGFSSADTNNRSENRRLSLSSTSSSEAISDPGNRRSVTTSSASSASAPVDDRHSVNASTFSAGRTTESPNRTDSMDVALSQEMVSADFGDTTAHVNTFESTELSTQSIMAKMHKQMIFYKCDNLTLNLK
ncbi:uncharacterized protein LOC119085184 [Bradysia coprophila]|uniref:uncharacterized protein LOC119085184 n=1 Tax=Bradysia coprophila TaxID=38358 RepID=UPI00187DCEDB|nr:uncharacterized protein LOC119085184 [Bradysia coprophila]